MFSQIIFCDADSCRGDDESDDDSIHKAEDEASYTADSTEVLRHCGEQEQCTRAAEMSVFLDEVRQNAIAPVEPEPIGGANLQSQPETDENAVLEFQPGDSSDRLWEEPLLGVASKSFTWQSFVDLARPALQHARAMEGFLRNAHGIRSRRSGDLHLSNELSHALAVRAAYTPDQARAARTARISSWMKTSEDVVQRVNRLMSRTMQDGTGFRQPTHFRPSHCEPFPQVLVIERAAVGFGDVPCPVMVAPLGREAGGNWYI